MKYQLLVEFDLKTCCHGRDENCDAAVLNDRDAATCLGEAMAEALICYSQALHDTEPTHLFARENVNSVRVYRVADSDTAIGTKH